MDRLAESGGEEDVEEAEEDDEDEGDREPPDMDEVFLNMSSSLAVSRVDDGAAGRALSVG